MKHCAVVVFLILLTACSGTSTLPEDHFYRLPVTSSVPTIGKQLSDMSILVEQIIADGLYRERAILHSKDAQAIEISQYHYHHWLDSPGRIIRDHLIHYLQQAGVTGPVVDTVLVPSKLGIYGKLVRFERHPLNGRDAVMVELLFRVELEGKDNPILLSSYKQAIEVDGSSMRDVIIAFEKALSGIFFVMLSELDQKIGL